MILDGEYTELIIPHKDASISERYVRTKRAFELNSIDPTQYHRVLLPPGKGKMPFFPFFYLSVFVISSYYYFLIYLMLGFYLFFTYLFSLIIIYLFFR